MKLGRKWSTSFARVRIAAMTVSLYVTVINCIKNVVRLVPRIVVIRLLIAVPVLNVVVVIVIVIVVVLCVIVVVVAAVIVVVIVRIVVVAIVVAVTAVDVVTDVMDVTAGDATAIVRAREREMSFEKVDLFVPQHQNILCRFLLFLFFQMHTGGGRLGG
eukprot:PhF_6_TR10586/c0_g1_i3/m.16939